MLKRPIPFWVYAVLFAGAYFATAELGRQLALRPGLSGAFWLPNGLYLAILLRSEPRRWPGLALAAFGANVVYDGLRQEPLAVCLGAATAVSLQGVAGAGLVRRFLGPSFTVARLDHLFGLAALIALGSTPVGATLGAAAVTLVYDATFSSTWLKWWIGDVVGVLVVMPLALAAFRDEHSPSLPRLTPLHALEGAGALLLVAVTVQYVFGTSWSDLPMPVVLIPPFIWIAIRFEWRGVALAVFVAALIAIRNTQLGHGPFVGPNFTLTMTVLRVQAFLSICSLAFLALAAVLHERRCAAEALRQRERRHHSLISAMSEMAWRTGPHGESVEVLPQWEELTGQAYDQARDDRWLEALHPDDRAATRERWQRALTTQQPYEAEYRVRRPDGQWRHLLARGQPVRDESGQVQEWVGVLIDDTERKQSEQLVRDARQMLETILNTIPQGVFWKDRHSRFLGCNTVVCRGFGFDGPQPIIGKTDFELPGPTPEQAAFFVQKDREVMESGQPLFGIIEQGTLADGSTIWMETNKVPLRDAEGQVIGILGTWQDITQRVQLEDQLRQAHKMEAIGRLAGGVAHDFNNLLTVITGYSDLLLLSLSATDRNRDALREIRKAAERAAALTQQLLAFSRQQVLQPKVIDLNEVVQQCEKMLRRLIEEDVHLSCTLGTLTARVQVDPAQIERVVLNLAVNARDAMPQGGQLTIATEQVELTEDDCRPYPGVEPGRFVVLAVSDTGCGMTPEVQRRIFEPFYTTKGLGKGTGLGLATVYGIVQQSEGYITVQSAVGQGTTFRIYLPAHEEKPEAEAPEAVSPLEVRGRETILLVEDEPGVRALARLALARHGYTVLEARNGVDALAVVANATGPIHLLLTDVVMPEMSGRQLADRLQPGHPAMKVLFMSGYTDDAVVRHGIVERETAFLQKPFAPLELARKVRDVLNSHA